LKYDANLINSTLDLPIHGFPGRVNLQEVLVGWAMICRRQVQGGTESPNFNN
jgi:hypothetical protein